ncbi:DeoR/GlpR family DNA-binding transcription regulator [Agromyces marinus]|uniref:Transcriptional regulator n=1 Tax=Agromyces marinus TaxID=1389020 RepID=A0ABM8H1P4_9MICO|nr:DeoR/GlpR family DNA-binding transcription regulator [Agromyces marinus]UIP57232.1 Glycerol-3-phosphate regulon repressor [Agromyces marinus]BDZ54678.1 transcriptional regulator [Agromyces marinus]
MNRSERLSALLELLAEAGQLEVDEIVERLEVSPATARRDLDALAREQLLTRTRGGARAFSVAYDLPLRYKNLQRPDAKTAIARAASGLVSPGAIIGLSGGTTTTGIATELLARPDLMEPGDDPGLTVVTNAVNIAMELAARPRIKTVVTGGVVHARSYELVGAHADAVLRGFTLDLAFIGVNAIDPALGPTVHDEREAAVNAAIAARAERAVVVADSSKIGRRAFATVGGPSLFGMLVTDSGITDEQRAQFETAGLEVVVADV